MEKAGNLLPRGKGTLQRVVASHGTCALLGALLAAACYLNSLQGALVHDDIFAIRDNADVKNTPLFQLLRNDFWGKPMSDPTSHKSYRPITVLSFRLDYYLHGLEPYGYHVTNLLLHVIVTCLFGVVCRVVVFGWWCDVAFLSTLLFAAHPVHTEAVSGIVGRADVLAALFFLLSLLAYHQTTVWSSGSRPVCRLPPSIWSGIWLLISVTSAAVAMLCKEHGATVLGVCFAYEVLVVSREKLLAGKCRSSVWLRLSVLLSSLAVLLALRLHLLHGVMPQFSAQDNPASFAPSLLVRTLSYFHLFYFNVALLLHPSLLCYDWQMGSVPLVEGWADARNLGSLLFLVYLLALGFTGVFGRQRAWHRRCVLVGLFLLVVPFLPATNIIRVGFVVAERILYIPSMGHCVLVAYGVYALSRVLKLDRQVFGSSFLFHSALLLVALYGIRTVARNPVWRTRESLFQSGLEAVPGNAKVWFNYANLLRDTGRTSEAILHYQTALRLAPDHAVSHNNLGSLLSGAQAEQHFRLATQHNPQHFRAFYNLGRNLQLQGRKEDAESAFRQSITINPDYHDALMSLASLLADSGRVNEGWPYMEHAAAVAPDNALVHNNVATYLLRLQRSEEAVASYQRAVNLDPSLTVALTSLGRLYRQQGLTSSAEQTFLRALSVRREAGTLSYLGALYFNTQHFAKARDAFREASLLEPANTEHICNHANSLLSLDQSDAAVGLLRLAISAHPRTACLHIAMATALAKTKAYEEASQHSSEAVVLTSPPSPSSPPSLPSAKVEALQVHAGIMKERGLLQEAVESYEAAVELDPTSTFLRSNLGAVLHLQKDYPAARKQYEAVLRLEPHNQLVRENLAKLERVERNLKPIG